MAYHDGIIIAFILLTTSDIFIARPRPYQNPFEILEAGDHETFKDNPCANPSDCDSLDKRLFEINYNNKKFRHLNLNMFIGFDVVNESGFDVVNQGVTHYRYRRNAMNTEEWPKSEDGLIYIPYIISDPETRARVSVNLARASKEYEKHTCVRLVPRTNQRDYVEIFNGDGCFTFVGRVGGRQLMSLKAGCEVFSIIIHEFMHVLGFYHEHERPDRDVHIKLNTTNIGKGLESQFKIRKGFVHGKDYDIHSIMHYGRRAGGRDKRYDVMTPLKDPNATLGVSLDASFSPGDIKGLNLKTLCGVNVTVYSGAYAGGSSIP